MRKTASLLVCLAAIVASPEVVMAQGAEYPIIVVPTGEAPYTFPEDYQTPWDKIEIMVTEKW